MCPIILHSKDRNARLYIEHSHRVGVHQRTENVEAFFQVSYFVIGLPKTLLSIYFKCSPCGQFEAQNIKSKMAPLTQ